MSLRSPPPGTLRAAAGFTAAGLIFVLVPLIAAAVTFEVVHAMDRHCSAPAVLRGSIAPERGLARLEATEERP